MLSEGKNGQNGKYAFYDKWKTLADWRFAIRKYRVKYGESPPEGFVMANHLWLGPVPVNKVNLVDDDTPL